MMDDEQSPEPQAAPLLIVGVGASAGGFEAFQRLLERLPADAPLCIVFVPHLLPTHKSMLTELLSRATPLSVEEAADGMPLVSGHVYVLPPNAFIEVREGKLRLTPRGTDGGPFLPIDRFFGSLAQEASERAIGVVLSGMGSDGAIGLRQIKEVGGVAFCQTPESADRDEMPRAAMAVGDADFVLPPEQIADSLLDLAHHPYVKHEGPTVERVRDLRPTEAQFHRIFAALRTASGVDFSHYKRPTVERRLLRRMALQKINSAADYVDRIEANPHEANLLYRDILIHVTFFFREPDSFATLAEKAFPELLKTRRRGDALRIWTPGCSSGEEPYSVAITLLEFLAEKADDLSVQIFATDVSEAAIETARAGLYPENAVRPVSEERLRRYFTQVDGKYRVNQDVRDLCVFARHDLARDPPFSRLDLVVCRNVLIYLDQPLQKRLFTGFHYALKPTGYLMLGGAETVGLQSELFSVVDKKHRLYSKRPTYLATLPLELPRIGQSPHSLAAPPPKAPRELGLHKTVQQEVSLLMLSKYAPPGVLLNDRLEIIQFRGQTGYFLEPPPGEVNLQVLKMVRPGLLHELQAALAEARTSEVPVRRENLRVAFDGHGRDVNLEVIPVLLPDELLHFLVLFEDVAANGARPTAASPPAALEPESLGPGAGGGARGRNELDQTRRELETTRRYLQSAIQDLEIANEELQSANEEVLSSNEELQSTNEELDTAKEELQSTNEELNTLNAELHSRNDELSRVNGDLINLLSSVQLAVIMVDRELRIRRFTPPAEKLFNLIPSDVGRPMQHIRPNIACPELEGWIRETIDNVTPIEREISDGDGSFYLLRVRPYCSVENRIEGAVIALFNIDAIKRSDGQPGE